MRDLAAFDDVGNNTVINKDIPDAVYVSRVDDSSAVYYYLHDDVLSLALALTRARTLALEFYPAFLNQLHSSPYPVISSQIRSSE